jgi:hypothetical protein
MSVRFRRCIDRRSRRLRANVHAAGAGLLALHAFVFDETSDSSGNLLFGATWAPGVCMQIGAGLAGRLRIARIKDRR